MADSQVRIELVVDDQGTVKIIQATKAVEELGQASAQTGVVAASANNEAVMALTSHLVAIERLAAAYFGLYGAIRLVQGGFEIFKSGISAVEDYKATIISAAAFMTNLTDPKRVDLTAAYREWTNYFQWLWKKSIEIDREVAASGREIFEVASEFAKKGVVATSEEQIRAIGRVTDFIRQVSPVYGEGLGARNIAQFRQEIRALFEGTVRPGNQLAQALEQIDANFKDNIANAIKTGKVLEYLNSLMGGAQIASQDMANTWGSVRATLESLWGELQRAAWGEGYRDIVKWGQELVSTLIRGGELTEEGRRLADGLAAAWRAVRDQVEAAFRYLIEHPEQVARNVESIATAAGKIATAFGSAVLEVSKLINLLSDLSRNPIFMGLAGAAFGSRFGGIGAAIGGAGGVAVGLGRQTEARLQDDLKRQATPRQQIGTGKLDVNAILAEAPPWAVRSQTDFSRLAGWLRPRVGDSTTGGGASRGAEAALNRLLQLTAAWEQEIARLTGSGLEELDAWYAKELERLNQIVAKAGESEHARLVLDQLYAAKRQKIEDDYSKWLAQHSGDPIKKILVDQNELLRKYRGIKDAEVQINQWAAREKLRIEQETDVKILGLYQGIYSNLGGLVPLLKQQNDLKQRALELEIRIGRIQLDRMLDELMLTGRLTKAQADELRALKALEGQLRRTAQAREAGTTWRSGVERAYIELRRQSEMGIAQGLQQALTSAPREIASAFSRGIWGAIRGEKVNIADLGMALGEAFTTKLLEMGLEYLMILGMEALGLAPVIEAGAVAAGGTLIGAGAVVAQEMIAGATTAAAILSAAGGLIPFLHAGGVIMHAGGEITRAHSGYLAPDERLIIAQTGEGVLSRRGMATLGLQNFHRLNRGEPLGGGPVVVNVTHAPTYYYRATEADYKRDARKIIRAIDQELSRRGSRIG
jgi:hypothetical protein